MPTPIYGLRFFSMSDEPSIPRATQELAEDVEATLQGDLELGGSLEVPNDLVIGDDTTIGGDLAVTGTVNLSSAVMRPQQAENDTDFTALSNDDTAPSAGSPSVGLSFTVPPSGSFWVVIQGRLRSMQVGCLAQLGWQLKTGTTIGSGTLLIDISTSRATFAGTAVVGGGPAQGGASNWYLVEGQSPGVTRNVRAMHWGAGSPIGYEVLFRRINVVPVP